MRAAHLRYGALPFQSRAVKLDSGWQAGVLGGRCCTDDRVKMVKTHRSGFEAGGRRYNGGDGRFAGNEDEGTISKDSSKKDGSVMMVWERGRRIGLNRRRSSRQT
jgi:hypothetical protein